MNSPIQRNEFRIRDATLDDVAALAYLHVRTFRETHGGGPNEAIRETQWRSALSAPKAGEFCILLETSNGDLIGFARGFPYTEPESPVFGGLLNKIYLLRDYHGRGLGRLILCSASNRFLGQGITSMLLFGDAQSSTNGFYEAMGGEKLLAANGEFHGGYGWRDLHALARLCDNYMQ